MHKLEKLGIYEEKATHIQREASQVDIKLPTATLIQLENKETKSAKLWRTVFPKNTVFNQIFFFFFLLLSPITAEINSSLKFIFTVIEAIWFKLSKYFLLFILHFEGIIVYWYISYEIALMCNSLNPPVLPLKN